MQRATTRDIFFRGNQQVVRIDNIAVNTTYDELKHYVMDLFGMPMDTSEYVEIAKGDAILTERQLEHLLNYGEDDELYFWLIVEPDVDENDCSGFKVMTYETLLNC